MKVEPFDTQRQMIFSRRATLLAGGVLVLFGGISARLYDLQVRRYDEFEGKAEDNRFKHRIVVPLRGEIIDRYGKAIATNRQNFRVLLVPEDTDNIAESIARLEQIISLTDSQRTRLLKDIQEKRNQAFVPIEVVDQLTWDQFAALNFHGSQLKGIVSEVGDTRYYPGGVPMGSVVGHVGSADARDLSRVNTEADRLLYLQPGFKLGKLGLEMTHDEELRGFAGTRTVEVTAAGRVLDGEEFRGTPAQQGDVLALTIDADLQSRAHEILTDNYGEYPEGTPGPEAPSASAVVIDVVTGDILVMASTPSFDPNMFAHRVDTASLRVLETSPLKPMLCKPLAGAYPPGSTYKLLTAIAALEAGISPQQKFNCTGSLRYGGHTHGCWKRTGHGLMNMEQAIKSSCDVYFYNCALKVEIDDLAKISRKFGLGQTYDLGIPGEVSGNVPDRAWKRAYYRTQPENQVWFPGETISVAIGQGAITSTPLQLAVMSARLATGLAVLPRIVRGNSGGIDLSPAFPLIDVSEADLAAVRNGMDAVVNKYGTAARSSLMPKYRMAGKTGTSQIRRLKLDPVTGRPVPNHALPWNERDHALFVSYAPFDNPRYACAVVVEHGGSGSRSAGPRARDIMRAVLDKDPANTERHKLWRPVRRDQTVDRGAQLQSEG